MIRKCGNKKWSVPNSGSLVASAVFALGEPKSRAIGVAGGEVQDFRFFSIVAAADRISRSSCATDFCSKAASSPEWS